MSPYLDHNIPELTELLHSEGFDRMGIGEAVLRSASDWNHTYEFVAHPLTSHKYLLNLNFCSGEVTSVVGVGSAILALLATVA